jgi:structural maintenance of chromosome 1
VRYVLSPSDNRLAFETTQQASTADRLASLRATTAKATNSLNQLSIDRKQVQAKLATLQSAVEAQREKMAEINSAYEQAIEVVETMRESSRKSQRSLDKALKDIAGWNDEIEQSASNRHALYRKCRLEEIDLPLLAGSLKKVPLDEVSDFDD